VESEGGLAKEVATPFSNLTALAKLVIRFDVEAMEAMAKLKEEVGRGAQ